MAVNVLSTERHESRLLCRGAEADIRLELWHGLWTIRKTRVPKTYRVESLDLALRRFRTAHEAIVIHDAKKAGVATPLIYLIDMARTAIVMQYVEGTRLKEYLEASEIDDRMRICKVLGDKVGRLHSFGIVHGDLTTSNVVVTKGSGVALVDFGLAEHSRELEKRGVDIVLAQRVFHSTHHGYGEECYKALLEGYQGRVGRKEADQVQNRVRQILRRGRYAIER